MVESIARNKSELFAIRIVNLCRHLIDKKKEFILSKQILRSGTSIGANLAESECAISKNDFAAKVYIVLKETVETAYWIRLLRNTNLITEKEFASLSKDCEELRKILSSTTKTLKDNLK